jgi:hypothetical protein
MSEYGFIKEEINFIMTYKPSFILQTPETERDKGIHALAKFLIEEKGYSMELVRTLVVKYPYILGKDLAHIKTYFTVMLDNGLSQEEAMRTLIDCPKLISI